MITLTLPPWTSATPTQPGVYRFRGSFVYGGRTIEMPMRQGYIWCDVQYPFGSKDLDERLHAWMFGEGRPFLVAAMRGEWAGPLVVEDDHA